MDTREQKIKEIYDFLTSSTSINSPDIFDGGLLRARNKLTKDEFKELYHKLDQTFEMECPREGGFTGYKFYYAMNGRDAALVELYIPPEAKRSSGVYREGWQFNKCRCNMARVEHIYLYPTREEINEAYSAWDTSFVYRKGELVCEPKFDDNRFNVCSNGIHFFMSKEETFGYFHLDQKLFENYIVKEVDIHDGEALYC